MKNQDGKNGSEHRFHGQDNGGFCFIYISLAGSLQKIAQSGADNAKVKDAEPALGGYVKFSFPKQEQADNGQKNCRQHLHEVQYHSPVFFYKFTGEKDLEGEAHRTDQRQCVSEAQRQVFSRDKSPTPKMAITAPAMLFILIFFFKIRNAIKGTITTFKAVRNAFLEGVVY